MHNLRQHRRTPRDNADLPALAELQRGWALPTMLRFKQAGSTNQSNWRFSRIDVAIISMAAFRQRNKRNKRPGLGALPSFLDKGLDRRDQRTDLVACISQDEHPFADPARRRVERHGADIFHDHADARQ